MKTRYYLLAIIVALAALAVLVMPSMGILPHTLVRFPGSVPKAAFVAAHGALPKSLWLAPAVPQLLRQVAAGWGAPVVEKEGEASLVLDVSGPGEPSAVWVYALVAPFPTVPDGVSSDELISSWRGASSGPFAGQPLLMDSATAAALTAVWGKPAAGAVRIVASDELVDTAWEQRPSWAIVPFEELNPRWKVLSIDGQSPVHKDFQLEGQQGQQSSPGYPLRVSFRVVCTQACEKTVLPALPASNRDPKHLTTVVMTGVTALVRATAFIMDTKGITYPGRDIHDWLAGADITHISNEVPFANDCPNPDPAYPKLVFCSDPHYIELLRSVGTDVVELTGNHYADFGPEAMLLTLKIYGQNNMAHYGGGADLQDARKPLLLEDHGNKIAFIGCNSPDVGKSPTATTSRPGAAPCDYDYMTSQIRQLRSQGYLVIATFQYYESYSPTPFEAQVHDFQLMADAGAVIVQGSQAHNPQSLAFDGNALIHYGLGNLFFDQMGDASNPTRQEFIDRHVFYEGRYISTELLSAELEDYARPRPMTPAEREVFLSKYFAASGW